MTARESEKDKTKRFSDRKYAEEFFSRNKRVKPYDVQVSRVHSLSWNCDGTRIACGSQDRKIAIGAVDNGYRVSKANMLSGHTDNVDEVSFHRTNPHVVASASADRTIRVWDIRAAHNNNKLKTAAANMNVGWSACGNYVVYGDSSDRLVLVDARVFKPVKEYQFKTEKNEFRCSPDGKYIYVTTLGGKVEVVNASDLTAERTVQAHSSQATCTTIAMSSDGGRVAVGANDAIVTLWDTEDMICESTVDRMDYPIRSISFSADGNLVAIGSEDYFVDIAWVEDGQRVVEVRTDSETFSVAWHPRQAILAYAVSAQERGRDANHSLRLFGFHSERE